MSHKMEVNIAMGGGGVSSIAALGALYYFLAERDIEIISFSGASIGAVNAALLAAKFVPVEICDFLAEHVEEFCTPRKGRMIIQKRIDELLDGMLFRELPKECIVSITPLRRNFPTIITRGNAEDLTVGEVVSLSAALPIYFRSGKVKLNGKTARILDGGLLYNPPLNPETKNIIFSFTRGQKRSFAPWNIRQARQEKKAQEVYKPQTITKTTGKREDVFCAFLEGKDYMQMICEK